MKKSFVLLLALTLALPLLLAARPARSGPGHVTIGADASVWDSAVAPDPTAGIFPIGGSGQVNGEFVLAERNGIQVGLRAQERFEGTIPVTADDGGKVGIYQADTGFSSGTRATWNYDWHVDLRDAHGVAAGTALADYDLDLEFDFADDIFGMGNPADLTLHSKLAGHVDDAVLYQESWNPGFGNSQYDPTEERTYNLRLVLTPKTFRGPSLAAKIEVDVTN